MSTEISMHDSIIFALVGHPVSQQKTSAHLEENDNLQCDVGLCLAEESIHASIDATRSASQSALIVVAIDFGTTFSGYSFAFVKDKSRVRYMRTNKGLDSMHKVPSALLMDPSMKFDSFGYEAQNRYWELYAQQNSKWNFFENFKMALHQHQKLDKAFSLSNASGTKRIKAATVFTCVLRHLCSQAMQEIGEQLAFELTKKDILWVVTVPSIWNDSSKQFMREAATNTGLVCPELLYITLESEVASLYCRHSLGKERQNRLNEEEGAMIYAIIDAGGGSVDVTFHQELSSGRIREVHKSSGIECGSLEVNKTFEELLAGLFGNALWREFREQCPSAYQDIIQQFELRKREARLERKNAYNIALQHLFVQFFASKSVSIEERFRASKCPKGLRYNPKLGLIRIEAELMIQLFDAIIEPMKRYIKCQVNCLLEKMDVKYAFLVGGFAQSAILRARMKEVLQPETCVLSPPNPQLAVLHGAVLFGLDPTVIESRRVMRTYGIAIMEKCDDATPHPHSETKMVTKGHKHWCCNVFDRFVTANQSIGLCEAVTRKYRPVFKTQAGMQAKIVKLEFYSTDKENVRYVNEPGVSRCGSIILQLEPLLEQQGSVNPIIEELLQREIEVQMFFGETEIKVCVTDLNTNKSIKTNVDFWDK